MGDVMRIQSAIILVSALALTACGQSDEQETTAPAEAMVEAARYAAPEPVVEDSTETLRAEATAAFHAFAEATFEEEVSMSPEYLTSLSRSERYDEWDDYSDNRYAATMDLDTRRLAAMSEMDFDLLTADAQISFLIMQERSEQRLIANQFFRNNYPVNHRRSLVSSANSFLANRHQVDNVSDAEDYITRINRLEPALAQISESVRTRVAYGTHPPAFMYPAIISEAEGLAALATTEMVDTHPIMIDFTAKVEALDIADEEKQTLTASARAGVLGPIARGYAGLIATLTDVQGLATTDDGIWRHPDGVAYYDALLRQRLGMDMTAAEVHDFGLAEVARIRGEMEAIKVQVGFEGTLDEFFVHLNEVDEFQYTDDDAGRAAHMVDFQSALDRVNAVALDYFHTTPVADVEIRRVEPYRQANAGRAFYSRPAPDGSTPGIFYANQRLMDNWRTWHVDTLVFHEAVPGHHFQIATAQELENVPTFQLYSGFGIFNEGWALYTEFLAKEAGLLEDPYADFGRLNAELFRAVRLVVDTGIHHHRWDQARAYEYMAANSALADNFVAGEIRRYMVWPTQALSYKMGMSEIQRQRIRAETALGDQFDIRDFHQVVIGSGSVPMPVLDELVTRYIAANMSE